MSMQHVMYKDIMASRMYVSYKDYDSFDITNKACLYAYRNNEIDMHEYIDNKLSPLYIKTNVIDVIKQFYELTEENEERITKLFSSLNPSVRLTIYSGGNVDRPKVFGDIDATKDIKKVLIELTGEINASAMDGLFSLYASALYYLEKEEDTPNAKRLMENYLRLINSSYIYMKRGTAMDFFFMPISDIEKAIDHKSISELMESADRFTEVYIKNNRISEDAT